MFCILGPGCSSIGFGAAVELGPLLVQNNGAGFDFNKHSWNNGHISFSFMLYVDSESFTNL